MSKFFLISLTLGVAVSLQNAYPCTTFQAERDHKSVIGYSSDWLIPHGHMVITPRGESKLAGFAKDNLIGTPLEWNSKYASLTFTQVGKDFPFAGMNEKGLTLTVMAASHTEYPVIEDQDYIVNEVQWVQVLLDTAASTREALRIAKRFKVSWEYMGLHYQICDRFKSCATVEFLNQELVAHKSIKVKSFTNSVYEESLLELQKYSGFGGTQPLPDDSENGSIERFVKATWYAKNWSAGGSLVNLGFDVLDRVAVGGSRRIQTQWQLLFQPWNRSSAFRTILSPEAKTLILTVALSNRDCTQGALIYDLDEVSSGGSISDSLRSWTQAEHENLISKVTYLSERQLDILREYPYINTRCN